MYAASPAATGRKNPHPTNFYQWQRGAADNPNIRTYHAYHLETALADSYFDRNFCAKSLLDIFL